MQTSTKPHAHMQACCVSTHEDGAPSSGGCSHVARTVDVNAVHGEILPCNRRAKTVTRGGGRERCANAEQTNEPYISHEAITYSKHNTAHTHTQHSAHANIRKHTQTHANTRKHTHTQSKHSRSSSPLCLHTSARVDFLPRSSMFQRRTVPSCEPVRYRLWFVGCHETAYTADTCAV